MTLVTSRPARATLAIVIALALSAAIAHGFGVFEARKGGSVLGTWGHFVLSGPYPLYWVSLMPGWIGWQCREAPSFAKALWVSSFLTTAPWLIQLWVNWSLPGDETSFAGDAEQFLSSWAAAGSWLAVVASFGALGGVVFRAVAFGWRR